MEPTSAHALFNSINQSNPIFIVDLREETSFARCHLRGAQLLSIQDCLDEDTFLQAMTKISKMNNITILFAVDGTAQKDALLNLIATINARVTAAKEAPETSNATADEGMKARWKNIISVEFVDFDDFYRAYPKCASLYFGTDFPAQTEKRPPKVYPTEIIPGFLYLGNYYDAADDVKMTDMCVTHIVDATCDYLSRDNAQKLNIAYLPVQVWDMEGVDIFQHFETVLAFILEAKGAQNGRILIHCRAGISRSATFVLAYLMYAGICPSLKSALELVVPQRPYVLPNPSFRAQLMDYEETLFSTRSFAHDNAFLACVSSMNFCWSGIFSMETDHDKIPIIAASQRINSEIYKQEYPTDPAEAQALQAKPKKAFLKRGGGKNTANRKAGQSAAGPVIATQQGSADVEARVEP